LAEKNLGGRPTKYTEELADAICEALVLHDRGLENLCQTREDFPTGRSVWNWKADNPEFLQKITRAQERLCERLMFETFSKVGTAQAEVLRTPGLNAYAQLVSKHSDLSMKLAAKVAPRAYGEKRQYEHKTSPDSPFTVRTEAAAVTDQLSDDARADILKIVQKEMQGTTDISEAPTKPRRSRQ
jgi:hypothetical protein